MDKPTILAVAYAILAAVTTAIWPVILSGSKSVDLLRYALVVAGALSALSFGLLPVETPPSRDGLVAGTLLCLYQLFIYQSVTRGGPVMQSLVNCNVALIVMYQQGSPTALLASCSVIFSSVTLVMVTQT